MNYKEQKHISVVLWSTNYISSSVIQTSVSQEPKYPAGTGKWPKWVRTLENKRMHTPAKGGCNHSPLGGCVGSGHCIVMWSIVQGMLKSEFLCKTLLIHKYWHHVWFLKHYKNETQYIQRPDLRYQVLTSDLNAIPFFFLGFLFISLLECGRLTMLLVSVQQSYSLS